MSQSDANGYNPRWLAWCHSQGRTPQEQTEFGRRHLKGLRNVEYMIWIRRKLERWQTTVGPARSLRFQGGWPDAVAEFDAWLAQQAEAERRALPPTPEAP